MGEVNAEEFRVVNADQFESMESKLDTLREELAKSLQEYAQLAADQIRKNTEWGNLKRDFEQRLTAAEQRNAELVELLELAYAAIDRGGKYSPLCASILAAMHPVESVTSE